MPSIATRTPLSRMSLAHVSDEPDRGPQATVIHGPPGIGKTSFVADAPGVIFLCAERGLKGIGNKRVAHFPYPNGWGEFTSALAELRDGEHAYRHLAIDSADWLESMIFRHVCRTNGTSHMDGQDYKKLYTAAVPHIEDLLRAFDQLRDRRKMHVWIIAHSMQVKVANAEGETWDKWDLKLDRRLAERLREWADNVFFANWLAAVKKGGKGRRSAGYHRGRGLFTIESADHFAKNRNSLPETMPLSFSDLQAALNAGRPATDASLRARIDELLPELAPEHQEAIRKDLQSYQPDNPRRLSIILTKAESLRALEEDGEDGDADESALGAEDSEAKEAQEAAEANPREERGRA
jgi:hypothetical protein